MLTGRRFRVEFTDEQAVFAEQTGAACRAVWNTGLEQRREYRRRGAWMNYQPQAKELAEAKAEHRWLALVPGHCLQQTLMDLDRACRDHGTFGVQWRSGRRWAPSFRFPEGNKMAVEKLNGRHARVKLPKLGWVKFRQTCPLDGETIRSATLTRAGEHWYVSFLVDDGVEVPQSHAAPDVAVGVDRGVVVAIGGAAACTVPVGQTLPKPGQDPRGAGQGARAGTSATAGLLRPECSPTRAAQRRGGARSAQD